MRVHIKTYGCTLNQADSDIIESVLKRSGAEITENGDSADVIVVNTCTVKSITAQKILYRLNRMEKAGMKVIATGCMAGANRNLIERYAPSASIVSTSNIGDIPKIAERLCKGERAVVDNHKIVDRLAFFEPRNEVIARIPINDGCISACTFCETRFARGPLNSFSEARIVDAITRSVIAGAKEVQLTSQDIGAYGRDTGTSITKLMERIAEIDGDFKVRIGMINPEHLHRCVDDFISAMNAPKFYKFVHIPVQSGSNKVLKEMGRCYKIEEFDACVKELRKKIDNVTIETDVIVGFPTESEEDFGATVDFIKRTD
jgi:MiaB-like tRNA modifying enzyme